VLDLGAGSACNSAFFSQAKYIAQDISQNDKGSIDFVYDITKSHGLIDNEYCNIIICTQVLEHINEPTKALDEMYRILEPEGVVYLTTHMAYEEHMLPHDYWRFTEYGIRYLVEQSGFQVEHFQRHGGTANALHYIFWTWPNRLFWKDRNTVGYFLFNGIMTPFILVTGIVAEFFDFIGKDLGIYTNFEIILRKSV